MTTTTSASHAYIAHTKIAATQAHGEITAYSACAKVMTLQAEADAALYDAHIEIATVQAEADIVPLGWYTEITTVQAESYIAEVCFRLAVLIRLVKEHSHSFFVIPVGQIDGKNRIFTLPVDAIALDVRLNGLAIRYVPIPINATVFRRFQLEEAPQPGDYLWCEVIRAEYK